MTIIVLYVILSVSGLLLLKMGASKNLSLSCSEGNLELKVNWAIIIGLVLYLMALITSLIAMRTIELSIFYPISAGLGYVLVCLVSWLVLKEVISGKQLVGMAFILVGVILMNLKK